MGAAEPCNRELILAIWLADGTQASPCAHLVNAAMGSLIGKGSTVDKSRRNVLNGPVAPALHPGYTVRLLRSTLGCPGGKNSAESMSRSEILRILLRSQIMGTLICTYVHTIASPLPFGREQPPGRHFFHVRSLREVWRRQR
jgi:hypothetical protein